MLAEPVRFSYRASEWAAQVASGTVSYTISHDQVKARWYLDASWSTPVTPTPSLGSLRAARTLGVDLNADHLAAWVLSPDGNPVGGALRIELKLDGSTSTRDGHLRQAITELLDIAEKQHCVSISIENLNFADTRATGREKMGMGKRGKAFRRTVSGIPTAKFRDRLSGMAANRGIYVIAVDPAYTSKWGAEHWTRPLSTQSKRSTLRSTSTLSRHASAAVVIGRRAQQHRARTSTRHLTGGRQRMASGEQARVAGAAVGSTPGNTGTIEGVGARSTKDLHPRDG